MNICVVGSGYVGLVTGACLADFGMHVVGVDKDRGKIDRLNEGEIPIYEPGLATLVRKNMEEKRLRFSPDLGPAIEEAQVVFIAVGTPQKEDGAADLTFIHEVASSIAQHLNGYKIIVTKSTVPIGTGQEIERIVREETGGRHDFSVVSNPEFLREGSAIKDFMYPDRVVIGTRDQRAAALMRDVYSPLAKAGVPFITTDIETAELIKYASNGFLATKISFINEVARICEAWRADVEVVAKGMGLDTRIGPQFLSAGPGFGGSCFPKDTSAAANIARQAGLRFHIIEAVIQVNAEVQARMVDKIGAALDGLSGKTVALLGLSFKPDTDDVRDSPALVIARGLLLGGARLRVYDPKAMEEFNKMIQDSKSGFPEDRLAEIDFCTDAYDAAKGADALVIVTEWNQFRKLEWDHLHKLLRQPLVIDLRNLYESEKMTAEGFRYVSIGRPEGTPEAQPYAVAEPAGSARARA